VIKVAKTPPVAAPGTITFELLCGQPELVKQRFDQSRVGGIDINQTSDVLQPDRRCPAGQANRRCRIELLPLCRQKDKLKRAPILVPALQQRAIDRGSEDPGFQTGKRDRKQGRDDDKGREYDEKGKPVPVWPRRGQGDVSGVAFPPGQIGRLILSGLLHIGVYGLIWRLSEKFLPLDLMMIALAAVLIWISLHDFATREIPDLASLALLALGLIRQFWIGWPFALDGLVGCVFWPLAFWAVGKGYEVTKGQGGLGFGDVKLMAGVGAFAGLAGGAFVVGAAAVAGVMTILIRRFLGRPDSTRLGLEAVAFGPFLCLSLWAHLAFWGLA
jgi:leader peptidase (prepilin peptidase) / N-methyltransferase